MANIPITPGAGADVATTTITRDTVTEHIQLIITADPVTGVGQSVTAPGTSGADAAAVQGITGGVPVPVSGTVAISGTTAVSVSNPNTTDSSSSATAIAVNSGSATIVKAAPGKLCRVLVTAAGTGPLVFYNNSSGSASGIILGYVPANASAGEVFDFAMPASVGISAPVQSGNPAVTVSFQ